MEDSSELLFLLFCFCWFLFFLTRQTHKRTNSLIGLKRYTAVSILYDSFCSVRISIRFPYFRFGLFLFLATLMKEVDELRTDI